jgi:glycosyltransferase involved in cell wall biosynthesis
MTHLVSIIVPTFNRASLLKETLDSILDQTYKHWECLVVDDGSQDDTTELMLGYTQKDERFKFLKRPANRPKGANACRNFGFENASGSFINWFDSDDLMHADKLQLQLEQLTNSSSDFSVCQTMVFEGNISNQKGLRNKNLASEDPFNDFVSHKIKWLTQAPLIRKSFLDKNDLKFDEQIQQSQELSFFSEVLALGATYETIDHSLVFFRKHEDSISYGKPSEAKLYSSCLVRLRILLRHSDKLNDDARKVVLKEMFSYYRELLIHRHYHSAKKILKDVAGNSKLFSTDERRRMQLAYHSYKNFRIGYKLLRI